MTETGKRANNATISDLGIKDATAHWNLSPDELANISIGKGQATLTSTGAININTGEFSISNIQLNKLNPENISDKIYVVKNFKELKSTIKKTLP